MATVTDFEQLESIIDVAKTVKGVTEIVNYVIVKD